MLRHLLSRFADLGGHVVEDVQPPGLRLGQRLGHHVAGHAGDLDVHLQGGDAAARAGDLEVHVPVVVSWPAMSLSTAKSSPALTRPMATPATGASMGTPASNNARELAQTVAIDEEPFDSRISETTRTV